MTTLADLRIRANALGYSVLVNVTDSMGRKWKYRTAPIVSGSWGQFKRLSELERYIEQVESNRENT